jgi:hypothetical protein
MHTAPVVRRRSALVEPNTHLTYSFFHVATDLSQLVGVNLELGVRCFYVVVVTSSPW